MDRIYRLGIGIGMMGITTLLVVVLRFIEPEGVDFFSNILIGVGVMLAGAGSAMLLARKPPAS